MNDKIWKQQTSFDSSWEYNMTWQYMPTDDWWDWKHQISFRAYSELQHHPDRGILIKDTDINLLSTVSYVQMINTKAFTVINIKH